MDSLVAGQRSTSTPTTTDEVTSSQDLPTDGPLSEDDVRRIHMEANNAGHFACILTMRLFPELFGPTNLRVLYNWNGNGHRNKKELDPVRKAMIYRYVCHFFPEMKPQQQFDMCIASKVNERLRRVEKKRPVTAITTQGVPTAPPQVVSLDLPATPTDREDLFSFDVTPSAFEGLRSYLEL